MVVGSVVRPRLVEAAIELFGVYGYEGVNMRQLAEFANTTTGTLYRLFSNKKEKVYEVAVNEAVNRALKAVAESVFLLLDNPDKEDLLSMVGQALKLWYNGLGRKEARLLLRIEIDDSKYRKLARSPFEKMTNHLAKALRQARGGGTKLDMHSVASAMIDALFKLKVSDHADADEQETLDDRLKQFVLLLSGK